MGPFFQILTAVGFFIGMLGIYVLILLWLRPWILWYFEIDKAVAALESLEQTAKRMVTPQMELQALGGMLLNFKEERAESTLAAIRVELHRLGFEHSVRQETDGHCSLILRGGDARVVHGRGKDVGSATVAAVERLLADSGYRSQARS